MMKNLNVRRIEMDELWVIVKKVVPRIEVYEEDGQWTLVAFALDSKLIVAFTIGSRKQYMQMNW